MTQIRAMFQAINSLKTLYKVRNTNPNYYSVVKPLNFPRNFRLFFNKSAEEGLGENKSSNNNNNYVEYSQSGKYKESSGGFLQDSLNRGNNSNPIRKHGLFSENLRSNYSSGYQESGNYSNNAEEFSKGYNVYHSLNNDNKYPLGSSGTFQHVSGNGYEGNAGAKLNSGVFHGGNVMSANGYAANYQQVSSSPFYNRTTDSQVVSSYGSFEESNDADKSSQLRGSLEELDAFCKEGKLKEAVEVMGLLEQQQISIDLQRYLLMIHACGEDEALEEAKYVHEHLMRSLNVLDVSTNNKILDMYGKCDSMEDACKVFNGMFQRNLTSWDTMITSLAKNGCGEDAIELFTEFKKTGLKPDSEMFFGVFFGCSVVGDVTEGLLHFESMRKDFGIVPSMKHYVSVVEMLASTGYLDEALEFIEKMPMEPSVDVWEALMNLCRVHGQTVLGDRCAELVEKLDPSHLDKYSKEGLIRVTAADITKEEEREKKKLARENPLEVKSRTHEYIAGDTSPESAKLYVLLWGLIQQMREEGYVPDVKFVLYDLDTEAKEDCLFAHSERLDVARKLINSPARSTLYVRKRIEVCYDCHNALMIISKLVGREICMQDANNFYCFKDRVC